MAFNEVMVIGNLRAEAVVRARRPVKTRGESHRLQANVIEILSLRKRYEGTPLLMSHFIKNLQCQCGTSCNSDRHRAKCHGRTAHVFVARQCARTLQCRESAITFGRNSLFPPPIQRSPL
jgi:hypothetical protein